MSERILVGLDGSESAFKALAAALDWAVRTGAELHAISVEEVPRFAGTVGEVVEEKEAANGRFAEVLGRAQRTAAEHGLALPTHVVIGHEVKSTMGSIKAHGFDLLVVGFMGHSALYDRVMGSTCQGLVRLAPCSVLVVK